LSRSSWAWSATGTRKAKAKATDLMRALPPGLCCFRSPLPLPIIIRHLRGRYDFKCEGARMNLLAWILCAAAWTGDGDDKEAAPRAPVRRQLPISAREAVNLSLNHNLDIEVARFQPW